jgi:hypothetical protein
MNKRLVLFFSMLLACLAFVQTASAQGPPPPPGPPSGGGPPCWPPPCIPVDGGLLFAIIGAGLFGGWMIYSTWRQKQVAG